jgi:pyruvate/2-oxoglutarate dehydrogenase complex dihydrolipoamide acyltransferase (E2) component
LSVARKALLWWFRWPGNPYVSVSVTLDFTQIRAYLAQVNGGRAQGAPPVSVHHWVVGAVTRLLVEFPMANARIVGGSIYRQPHVGVAMPVNLLDQARPNENGETALTIVERAEGMSLREVAGASRRMVEAERSGRSAHPLVRAVTETAKRLPYGVLSAGLSVLERVSSAPLIRDVAQRLIPMTTAVSNVGAALAMPPGALLRAAATELPQRLLHIGTLWGVSGVQDEVFAVEGVPTVRPALPIILIFDHRLIDGVLAGRILLRLSEIAQDPAVVFGPDGSWPIGQGQGRHRSDNTSSGGT